MHQSQFFPVAFSFSFSLRRLLLCVFTTYFTLFIQLVLKETAGEKRSAIDGHSCSCILYTQQFIMCIKYLKSSSDACLVIISCFSSKPIYNHFRSIYLLHEVLYTKPNQINTSKCHQYFVGWHLSLSLIANKKSCYKSMHLSKSPEWIVHVFHFSNLLLRRRNGVVWNFLLELSNFPPNLNWTGWEKKRIFTMRWNKSRGRDIYSCSLYISKKWG